MRAVISRLLVTVMVMVAVTTSAQGARAQSDGPPSEPTDAAVELSRLEAEGEFDELYDRLHPDAQEVVPRAAVVGFYEQEFAPLGPGILTVTDVRFEAWTWAVTGVTYPNTARVAYRQPYADGTVSEGGMALVEHEGEWRWFFSNSAVFIEEVIAKYGDDAASARGACDGADQWWAETYPRTVAMDYMLSSFEQVMAVPLPDAALLASYAEGFTRLHDEQDRSTPPPAADELNAELMTAFGTYEEAMGDLASVASGNMSPLAARGAVAAAMRGIDEGAAIRLHLPEKIDAFLDACNPQVAFVSGFGDDLPVGVVAGEIGPDVPIVDCFAFPSRAEAQEFFEAAGAGDPHHLDEDGDGIACEPPPFP